MGDTTEQVMETLEALQAEIHKVRLELEETTRRQTSTSSRIWDIATKLTVAGVIALFGYVNTIGTQATRNDTRLQKIEETRFTREDALALKEAVLDKDNLQITLLVQEMRAMTVTFVERLTRLETQVTYLNTSPK